MATKKELLEQEVAKAVGAGKIAALETVNFNDENRPPTCLEVDFPILPINQVAVIEGNAGKPIYQMSKWWARRRSSVFRSMLIAAATKAPADKSHAAKLVWDNYYANHQKKGAFKHLKVADIFMGGGTTLVEGSRLGMQMSGNDLNPIAWFVVRQEFAKVDLDEVKRLLADIEAEVKPQIIPFYYCDGPNGQKGEWTHVPTGKVMGKKFDPLTLTPEQRFEYKYDGPEIIYTFWAKHGPCQVLGCGHRTPIITSTVVAIKTLSVKYWERICGKCGTRFHAEEHSTRMAPDVPLYVAPSEKAYSVIDPDHGIVCPKCHHTWMAKLGPSKTKKVELTLLIHPQWLAGSQSQDSSGKPFGGSAQDDVESTSRWDRERAKKIRLLEVRGELPETVTCPETNVSIKTGKRSGTVPKNSYYECAACGTGQDVLETVKATGKTGPMAGYAIQGYAPQSHDNGDAYGGRFFQPFDARIAAQYDAALREWESRKNSDLLPYWPQSELPYGFMTHHLQGGVPNHGFTHWWTMFNPRQLLVHTLLLKSLMTVGKYSWEAREFVLGAFQQYLRNQNLFCFWDISRDCLAPHMSNNNYHPKNNLIENCVFSQLGRGNWESSSTGAVEGIEWARTPWEVVSVETLKRNSPVLGAQFKSKSTKAMPGDPLLSAEVCQGSSTDLVKVDQSSIDLVITDPPFGGLLHYSELSDFFYVWLRLVLRSKYPEAFDPEFTPKALEVVSNRAREPEDPDGFYQRLLTRCWVEAKRILKPGGLLAFTFHHSEDEPWIAVLESLFDAGFYLEATYPIRSDETKGDGDFGSKTIEYDIIHVCRKRTEEPTPVSWGRMRREVLADVRQLQGMLENHAKQGLPSADLQVIRRGKALEYFSRHYGKVYVDEGRAISVKEALVGIIQLIDEDADKGKEPPPVNAEPMTRQFLRIFDGKSELARDQLQKFLRGSVTTPDDFEQRGWCAEETKVFAPVNPLAFAQDWSGKHRRRLTSDMDQALVLIGACFENSGINATDTLKNENFRPHVALKPVLEWFQNHGGDRQTRTAASRAVSIFNAWMASRKAEQVQGSLFEDYEQ
jgi:DNA-directed RNA polymerase subunit RPC12/RpoP